MNIDFGYKILELKNYLSNNEFILLESLINNFDIELNEINGSLGFLQWSNEVQYQCSNIDNERYLKMSDSNNITYDDFCFLKKLNDEHGFGTDDYFNFLLTHKIDVLKTNEIYSLLSKSYNNILFDLFNKKIDQKFIDSLFGHINVYPEGSFIRKHFDRDPTNERIFTTIFFLNNDRKIEDGSILKLYTKDGEIEVIPNFKTCVLLEHTNFNYIHEVTKNLSKDIRYSIYSPFTINDYNEKLINV
jgi:Rps23 Pro-64 3,4-dihydroxylase Tpa1-like proline 4-hydroxylase